jgi:DNA adenine methylase
MEAMPTKFSSGLSLVRGQEPPPPFPYQGSKRKLAPAIVACVPEDVTAFFEPFCGSAAVSLAVGTVLPALPIYLNDYNQALADLWLSVLEQPEDLAEAYRALWTQQLDDPRAFYDEMRDKFNATGDPVLFLYLLARCVKAAVRYNSSGEFNQSPDNRRLGSKPDRMRANILAAAGILRGRTTVTSVDFQEAMAGATESDVVYMDPPYQGVSTNRDRRYADVLAYETFVDALNSLNKRNISYIISYDGRTGSKVHGKPLPSSLGLHHFDIEAGRSSQSTLAGRDDETVESLYLSAPLIKRLGGPPQHLAVARSYL